LLSIYNLFIIYYILSISVADGAHSLELHQFSCNAVVPRIMPAMPHHPTPVRPVDRPDSIAKSASAKLTRHHVLSSVASYLSSATTSSSPADSSAISSSATALYSAACSFSSAASRPQPRILLYRCLRNHVLLRRRLPLIRRRRYHRVLLRRILLRRCNRQHPVLLRHYLRHHVLLRRSLLLRLLYRLFICRLFLRLHRVCCRLILPDCLFPRLLLHCRSRSSPSSPSPPLTESKWRQTKNKN
jgi:hypothetical protein